jgi:hypothetical protein
MSKEIEVLIILSTLLYIVSNYPTVTHKNILKNKKERKLQ